MFKELFGQKNFHNDEDYKKFLKAQNQFYLLMILFGIVFSGVVTFVENQLELNLSDFMSGFFAGAGGGLIGAGLVLLIRNRRIMSNSELLHKLRVKLSDERNVMIGSAAVRWASMVQLLAACFLALFGILIDPILTFVGMVLLYLYLFTYLISYWLVGRKM